MAVHMSPAFRLLLTTKNVFLRRNCVVYSVEQIRSVRALRRKPIRVLFPEKEAETTRNQSKSVVERKSKERRAEPKVLSSSAEKETRSWREETSAPKERTQENSVKYALSSGSNHGPEGLCFEKASPGDKRLA